MLSTHSPPQKWRNMVAFTTLSTSGAATLREARMMASAFSTSGLKLHALKTAKDWISFPVLFACTPLHTFNHAGSQSGLSIPERAATLGKGLMDVSARTARGLKLHTVKSAGDWSSFPALFVCTLRQ